jgi:hypothetical protein
MEWRAGGGFWKSGFIVVWGERVPVKPVNGKRSCGVQRRGGACFVESGEAVRPREL